MIPDYDGEKKYPREEIHWSDNFDSWKDWLASQDGDLESNDKFDNKSDDSMARAKCDETSVEALSRKSCKNKDLREKEKKSLTGVE